MVQEQYDDPSLTGCWKLAEKGRAGFVVNDNLCNNNTNTNTNDNVYGAVIMARPLREFTCLGVVLPSNCGQLKGSVQEQCGFSSFEKNAFKVSHKLLDNFMSG